MTAAASDRQRVADLLGRAPRGDFEVVRRDANGAPLVIRNAPLLDDGTPMPTRFWLVGVAARRAVDRLEASGGVRAAEAELDPAQVAAAHRRYAAERDAALPAGWAGNRPAGGVGGTRHGVKCLHAHYAWYLAGGDDPVGRWTAARLGAGEAVAAVDCGTNSTRLLVADGQGRALTRLMRITRLGQGVDRCGVLAPDAVARTVAVLEEYRKVMDDAGVGPVRMTATSAVRDAGNRDQFLDAAAETVGTAPEILTGEQEGRLSFAGATADLDDNPGGWLVADIGGGSTELAAGPVPGGRRTEPAAVCSLDVGCVRVTERFLTGDPPDASQLEAARRDVHRLLASAVADQPVLAEMATLVGLAGTVAALAAVDQRLETYDRDRLHHHVLTRETVDTITAELAGVPAVERARRPGVEAGRADVLVGGALVLSVVMDHFGFAQCLTSEADILDGLVMTLVGA